MQLTQPLTPAGLPDRPSATGSPTSRVGAGALKVPTITALFWIVKLLTTGIGESGSDFLAQRTLLIPAIIGSVGLALALWRQLHAERYHAPTYWFTVAMVAVFGTVVADVFNPQAGGIFNVALPITAGAYLIALTICLTLWYRREGTLSIHAINTRRREGFYWVTVLLTFALGTAAGDWTAFYVNLGFSTSILAFALAMLIPLTLWRLGVNPIITFWMAYILTRPLGASIADELGKASPLGLGFGDGRLTSLGIIAFIALVSYLRRSRIDDPQTVSPDGRRRFPRRESPVPAR